MQLPQTNIKTENKIKGIINSGYLSNNHRANKGNNPVTSPKIIAIIVASNILNFIINSFQIS